MFGHSKEIKIYSPVDGEVVQLSTVEDDVFAQGMLGDGFALVPSDGVFVAPMDGKLITVFPTGHAYGIKHKSGVEALLHIGLDTVTLNGEGFSIKVKQDQKVDVGDLLVEVDLAKITPKIPSIKTPLVFSEDSLDGKKIHDVKYGPVKKGDLVAVIK